MKYGTCIRIKQFIEQNQSQARPVWEYFEVHRTEKLANGVLVVGQDVGLDASGSRGVRRQVVLTDNEFALAERYAITTGSAVVESLVTIVAIGVICWLAARVF